MFTKCLWGGQEVVDIRDIIESGKYEIKGLSFNYDSYDEKNASVTVNQSGYLLYFKLKGEYSSNYYTGYNINTQLSINTGIANNTLTSKNIGEDCMYMFRCLDKEDYVYNFDVGNKQESYNINMKRGKYSFPSNDDLNYFTINTNSSINVNNIPNDPNTSGKRYYNYISYYPIKFNKLVATISYTSNSTGIENYEEQAGELVYAIQK